MRVIFLISALVAAVSFAACGLPMDKVISLARFDAPPAKTVSVDSQGVTDSTPHVDLISGIERYEDSEYGFSVAVPSGWSRIVSAEPDDTRHSELQAWLEPGYAVGFESPRLNSIDRFADYILIELLPGEETGLFEATAEHRHYLLSGEEKIAYDKLTISSESDSQSDVDLVIFQRGVQSVGYTLSFYAIGEPANERALFDAFQIMLRTFTQIEDPFLII